MVFGFATLSLSAQTAPVLLAQNGRAIALESPTMNAEPFSVQSKVVWSSDTRTRIMLFCQNVSNVATVNGIDMLGESHSLLVEFVGQLQDEPDLNFVVVILPRELDGAGELSVSITANGIQSNSAKIDVSWLDSHNAEIKTLADWNAANLQEPSVSVWPDSSGNHNDAIQPDPAKQPTISTDGGKSVSFGASGYLKFPELTNVRIVQAVIKYDLSLDDTADLPPIVGHLSNYTWSGSEGTHIFGMNTSAAVMQGRAFWNSTPIPPTQICKPSQGFAVLTFAANADTVLDLIGSDRLGHFLKGNIVRLILYSGNATNFQLQTLANSLTSQYQFPQLPVVVAEGSSIVADQPMYLGGSNTSWATHLMRKLPAKLGPYQTFNLAFGGQPTSQIVANFSHDILPIANIQASRKLLIVQEGINDLVKIPGPTTAQDAYNNFVALAKLGKQTGFDVVITTVTPFDLSSLNRDTSEFEPKRLELNSLLRANAPLVNFTVCDIASDPRLTDPNNSDYFAPDKVHFKPAGAEVIADLITDCVHASVLSR